MNVVFYAVQDPTLVSFFKTDSALWDGFLVAFFQNDFGY